MMRPLGICGVLSIEQLLLDCLLKFRFGLLRIAEGLPGEATEAVVFRHIISSFGDLGGLVGDDGFQMPSQHSRDGGLAVGFRELHDGFVFVVQHAEAPFETKDH